MKKTLIITSIATPILTLSLLLSYDFVKKESQNINEAISIVNKPEEIKPTVIDTTKSTQEESKAPEIKETVNNSSSKQETVVEAPKLVYNDIYKVLLYESESLNKEKTLRINSSELVYIVLYNFDLSKTEEEAIALLHSCKMFYDSMKTNTIEFNRARFNKQCS